MAGKIFVNYRRNDDPGYTQALYQRLEERFPPDSLFMDVEGHIKPGDDFVEVLGAQVAASDVVLAVIGPRWLDAANERGQRRLDDPDDFVRIEIASALQQEKRLIPVLVGGADIPRSDQLPDPLRGLARKQMVRLTPERSRSDCQGLIGALEDALEKAEVERREASEQERLRAEDARRNREAEDAARIAKAEERTRWKVESGMSPQAIRKAEELANWEFAKGRDDKGGLRDHLARFPDGVTERFASARLAELAWADADNAHTIEAYSAYLRAWPFGFYVAEANARIRALKWTLEARRRWVWVGGGGMAVVGALAGGMALYGAFEPPIEPGSTFKDCDTCPKMVVVPAGSFLMGSTWREGPSDERPQHEVTIAKSFAVGKFEVTFAEWDACVKDGGCSHKPGDSDWGRGSRPVISVSWMDTREYIGWLNGKTGESYRLLSEAEWEYAARAGSETIYSWGDDIGKGNANCFGCGRWWDFEKTAPVGSFAANAFGLHDMHGNVMEWVADPWHDNYGGSP